MKEIVRGSAHKHIKYIQFGALGPDDIAQVAETEIWQRELYDVANKCPFPGGVLDRRLGAANKESQCLTCGKNLAECAGHFGFIQLALPVFHAGYFKATVSILQQICKDCGCILMEERERRSYLKRLRAPNLENPVKMGILKKVNEACRKILNCPTCGATNGVVKKVGICKIIHEKYRAKSKQDELEHFRKSFKSALAASPEIKPHLGKAVEDMNPQRVLELFKRISSEDCEIMGMDPKFGRPERFLWTAVPVPPACIRPSVAMDRSDLGSNEDDLTMKMAEIITMNNMIQKALTEGEPIGKIAEDWDFLQLVCAQFVNSEMPGLAAASQAGRSIRGLCQRLKGKQGRFRGNLSGKRVDFSGRTVISPDPNLRIDQVAVPEHVSKILTYPETVNVHNIEKLRQCVRNGPDIHPGANYISPRNGMKRFLKFVTDRNKAAKDLRTGDVVERHLADGDVVLFNRQPSLHKLSIMSHFVKVRPWRTFRFNECVCTPYNADFDGDEMNLHVPQTEEARAEAVELMGVKNNLVTPRNGQPLIAATQDFITGAYLVTQKDLFYTRAQFCQAVGFMTDAGMRIDIPPPAIIKPMRLWTGKQIMNVLMRPNKQTKPAVNLETKNRSFAKDPNRIPDLCPNDGYVVIRNSELMCGSIDKAIVGDGNKKSMFYVVLRDMSPIDAAACMNRLAKFCARWMANRGFSIGINDVTPGERLSKLRDEVIMKGYGECDELIEQHRLGKLPCQPGCDIDQTLEAQVSGKLSKIRDDLGQICLQELSPHNAPLVMSICGSKGSKINVCQMVACVGQQIISGSRIADGFDDRTLPHFKKHSRSPAAKGFVRNSFYTGLSPTEFIFHAASGREGLVDTAVKTAETGYMQRRLMKALEDLAIQYDYSVRNSAGIVIQFDYGNDRLDPALMEGEEKPVDFERSFLSSRYQNLDNTVCIPANEMMQKLEELLRDPSFNCSPQFADSIKDFVNTQVVERIAQLNERHSLEASNKVMSLTERQLKAFVDTCRSKFFRARIEPGTAVGALGAQSIGEPGTQMTLKTFHFAGVASMNVTLGVPRIKEIINASKTINTPIIRASLVCDDKEAAARIVKGRVETTTLGDISEYIEENISSSRTFVEIRIDPETVRSLQLEVDVSSVCDAIVRAPKLKIPDSVIHIVGKWVIRIDVVSNDPAETFYQLQNYKRALPKVVVKGVPTIVRAVINEQEGHPGRFELLAEGYGLKDVMTIDGIIGTETVSNHIMEVEKVLGIEAARQSIIEQIQYTMSKHGMTIDIRHVMLLADIMTFKGEVLGITRHGIARMKDSVLMLASFERTADHLFDAALYGKKDTVEGVSECIIMGTPMPIGTGLFQVMQRPTGDEKSSMIVLRELLFDLPEYHPTLKKLTQTKQEVND